MIYLHVLQILHHMLHKVGSILPMEPEQAYSYMRLGLRPPISLGYLLVCTRCLGLDHPIMPVMLPKVKLLHFHMCLQDKTPLG